MSVAEIAASARRGARLFALPLSPWGLIVGAIAVLVAAGVTVPLLLTLLMSVKQGLLTQPGALSLEAYQSAWSQPTSRGALANTVLFAAGTTLVALGFGVPLALIAERSDLRFRHLFLPLMTVKLVMPVYIVAMAWILLLSPTIGVINIVLMGLLGLETAPFTIYGVAGMAFVQGLSLASVAYFMMSGVFRAMDATLEEAAHVAGVSKLRTFWRVNLPLAWPGLLGAIIYIFMIGMGSFEVPAIIGAPQGVYVLSTEIYRAVSPDAGLPKYNLAAAFGSVLLLAGLVLMYAYWKLLGASRKYAVVTGHGYRTAPLRLGPKSVLVGVFAGTYFALALLLPFLALVWVSLNRYVRPVSPDAFGELGFDAYGRLFGIIGLQPFLNTLLLVLVAPTAAVLLSFMVSWIVLRTQAPGRSVLDTLAFLPHATPAVLMAVAFAFLFLSLYGFVPIYGTLWSLVIVMVIMKLPFGTRTINATLIQLHAELEEAGRVAGIPSRKIVWRVLVPLLAPVLLNTWLWLALIAYREVTVPVVLSSPQNQVVSTAIWRLWQTSRIPEAAALGVVVMLFALVVIFAAGRAIRRVAAISV